MANYIQRLSRCGLTAHDQFCGAGGTSTGADLAGVQVIAAMNHNHLVLKSHGLNHPDIEHDCADLSLTHPSRYARADILFASPSCTHHSTAAGARRKKARQIEIDFEGRAVRPEDIGDRSRATMWEVPKFAEYHRYEAMVVENVNDVTRWECFESWLGVLHSLGYQHKLVSLNAMFARGFTPQDRDRFYMVFWKKGNRAPNLDIRPFAHCVRCNADVRARQTWKLNRKTGTPYWYGDYRERYIYTCPTCRAAVEPYRAGIINAIDPTVPARTIRAKHHAGWKGEETIRIRLGKAYDRHGRVPTLVTNNCTTHDGRVRSIFEPSFALTCSNTTAIVMPPDGPGVDIAGRWPEAARPAWSVVAPEREALAADLLARTRSAEAWDDFTYRTLIPEERLRIMGFPVGYRLVGTDGEQHMQIGNANPPTACYELAARVAASLVPEMYPEEFHPLAA